MTVNKVTHVVGYGALGREIVRHLLAAGRPSETRLAEADNSFRAVA